ncbi:MAG: hypothetical protein LBD07_02035, partial [Spirochaetaceae bacterium]|nr:hypothetical protein [Spirochaetaceae bacterium]
LAGFFHSLFFDEHLAQIYKDALKKREPPKPKQLICPVCAHVYTSDSRQCPKCEFLTSGINNDAAVQKARDLYAMPDDKRAAYNRKVNSLWTKGGFAAAFRLMPEIKQEFGLAL